jgi:hypothetical protein
MVGNGGIQSARQELCLQCEKPVAPDARLAVEVTDENGRLMGYLHPRVTARQPGLKLTHRSHKNEGQRALRADPQEK